MNEHPAMEAIKLAMDTQKDKCNFVSFFNELKSLYKKYNLSLRPTGRMGLDAGIIVENFKKENLKFIKDPWGFILDYKKDGD
jgi:hypothetical protein